MSDGISKIEHEGSDLNDDKKNSSFISNIFYLIAFSMTTFHLFTSGYETFPAFLQRSTHLAFVIVLGFYAYRSRYLLADIGLGVLGLISCLYVAINYAGDEFSMRILYVSPVTALQTTLCVIMIVVLLELTRRTIGSVLSALGILALAYAFVGSYLPGALKHQGIPFNNLVEQLYLSTEGIWGIAIAVSATFVFMFILFGAFLEKNGTGQFFIDLAQSALGKVSGGPALMAVMTSAMFGSISGSAVANVMATGSFTIPLMKKTGYHREFAGAVEAVASTGGQIMPPLMGAGAFIMAEIIGIPYISIAISAVIPALMFFLSVGTMIYIRAKKLGLKGVDGELPSVWHVVKTQFYLVVPVIAVVVILLAGFTPTRAAFYAIVIGIAVMVFQKGGWSRVKELPGAMVDAAKRSVPVASACATAGILIAVVRLSGLAFQFAGFVVDISAGNLIVALIVSMVASILFGMGLPTTVAYLIQASLIAPALVELGLHPLQAHLFVFYFSIMAVITPPVALAAYAAASISDGNPMKIGFNAFRLGIAAYLIPFLFAYSPALLIVDSTGFEVGMAIITGIAGVCSLGIGLEGWLKVDINPMFRALFLVAAFMLCVPHLWTDVIGGVLFVVLLVLQIQKAKVVEAKILTV